MDIYYIDDMCYLLLGHANSMIGQIQFVVIIIELVSANVLPFSLAIPPASECKGAQAHMSNEPPYADVQLPKL